MMIRASKIQVALENGSLVMCDVVERMGFNPDISARTAWVKHEGKEFMAFNKLGAWRKWGPKDRTQPLVEHYEREAKRKAEKQS